jgi:hypothetical protein
LRNRRNLGKCRAWGVEDDVGDRIAKETEVDVAVDASELTHA